MYIYKLFKVNGKIGKHTTSVATWKSKNVFFVVRIVLRSSQFFLINLEILRFGFSLPIKLTDFFYTKIDTKTNKN